MCDASLAALERLLMTPRHKFGPSHEWLANWNFPPPKAWAEARRLAAARSNPPLRVEVPGSLRAMLGSPAPVSL